MKRFYLIILAAVLTVALAAPAMAGGQWKFSTQTGDAQIAATPSKFVGIIVSPDGTNDCTFDFYDNTAGSGTKFLPSMTFSGTGGPQALILPKAMPTNVGLYVNITLGAGTIAYTVITEE